MPARVVENERSSPGSIVAESPDGATLVVEVARLAGLALDPRRHDDRRRLDECAQDQATAGRAV